MAELSNRPLRVFLCHASGDKPKVRELYQHLIADGVDAWLDEENILPGQDWHIEISAAVRTSDVVIVCLSKDSITKEGYIQKEIRIALDVADEKPEGTIFIIPARLEDCHLPERINRWQSVDLYSTSNDFDDQKYKKLVNALELRLAQIAVPSPQNNVQNTKYQFEPNELTLMPPRAWLYPIPKDILNSPKSYSIDYEAAARIATNIEKILIH